MAKRKLTATARNGTQTVKAARDVARGMRATSHSVNAAKRNIPAAVKAGKDLVSGTTVKSRAAKLNAKLAANYGRAALRSFGKRDFTNGTRYGVEAIRNGYQAFKNAAEFRRAARAAYGSTKAIAQRGKNGIKAAIRTEKAAQRTAKSIRSEYNGAGRGASNASQV